MQNVEIQSNRSQNYTTEKLPSENNQVSAHELTITKISNLKSLKAEDDVASDPEQLHYVPENKTAPATS